MQFRHHRYATHYPLDLGCPKGRQWVIVTNIHRFGARIEDTQNLEVGDLVKFPLEFDQIDARVLWIASSHAGIRFERPLIDTQVDAMRQMQRATQPLPPRQRGTRPFPMSLARRSGTFVMQ